MIFKFLSCTLSNDKSEMFCVVMHVNYCRTLKICGIVLESKEVCSRNSSREHGCVCQGKQQRTHDIQTFERIPGRRGAKWNKKKVWIKVISLKYIAQYRFF